MISFDPSTFSMSPLFQTQPNPARAQDSSVEGAQRRDEAYRAQSGAAAGAPMAKLQETLMNRLVERIPGVSVADLEKRNPADFSPQAIADRIGQFVGKGLENARAQGRSDKEVQSLYDSALKGMEQGLADAKDVLDGLGLLNGKIADDVDETGKLTREALAELDPSRKRDQVDLAGGAARSAGMSIAERYSSASSFEMQLRTQEGDEITVSFGQRSEFSASAAAYADSDGNRAAAYSMSRTEEFGYSFSVKGNLSEDEMTAIRDLVRDVNQMADDFFGGDVQKAFDQAGDMRFDSSQLASLELSMSQSQQYTAAQAYRETQRNAAPAEEQRPGLRLGQLINDMRDRFSQSVLDFLDKPQEVGSGLMRGLVEQDTRMRDAPADSRERMRANLENLLSSVNQSPANEAPEAQSSGEPSVDLETA